MRLYVVQHGESESKETNPEQPLTERGRLDVERLAAFLSRLDLKLSRLFHSEKLRAKQTAELLQWAIGTKVSPRMEPGLGPNDPVAPVAQQAEQWDGGSMLVGHLPFVERLVSQLVAGSEDVAIAQFVPGTSVCLERNPEGRWSVVWMIRPELLVREE